MTHFLIGEDLSGDEVLVLLAGVAVSLIGWGRWYYRVSAFRPPGGRGGTRPALLLLLPICLDVLVPVLAKWSAPDVRSNPVYILLFTAAGAALLVVSAEALAILGISVWQDALDRRNIAALLAVCGSCGGVTLAYTGANIGAGPTIWTTLGPAALAVATLAVLALGLVTLGGAAEAITVGRDVASGWRFAGLMTSAGLILGRAVAGDYVSADATIHDFIHAGWPALVLTIMAIRFQVWLKPSPRRPVPSRIRTGFIPAAAIVALAVAWVIALGHW